MPSLSGTFEKSCQGSIHCEYTQGVGVDKCSDKNLKILSNWMVLQEPSKSGGATM